MLFLQHNVLYSISSDLEVLLSFGWLVVPGEGCYEELQSIIIPWENMSSHPCSWGGGRVGFGPKDEGVRRGDYF